jgi:glutamyl-tRNA synthetase
VPLEELVPFVEKELKAEGLWQDSYAGDDRDWFFKTVDLIRARFHTLKDFSSRGRSYFSDTYEFEEKAVKKNLSDPMLEDLLPELANRLEALPQFVHDPIEDVFRTYAEQKDVKAGLLINAVRTAASGTSVGPGLFEMLETLGKGRVVSRLRRIGDHLSPAKSENEEAVIG